MLLTVTDRVNAGDNTSTSCPLTAMREATGRLSVFDNDATTRSRLPCCFSTVTSTDAEQLFVVSDSSVTGSTHAP